MIGYIYKTTNFVNGKVYIGKHISENFDPKYYGSGKALKRAIKKYGKKNFSVKIIREVNQGENIDEIEKSFILKYKTELGRNCYNLAEGGEGGNVFKYSSEEEKEKFVDKMTKINRVRCNSQSFKKAISESSIRRYESEDERKKQSERISKSWANPELRKRQSERVLDWYKNNSIDHSYAFKPCYLIVEGNLHNFNSKKNCEEFLRDTYNCVPNNLETFTKDNPYKSFRKKFRILDGMIFGYGNIQRKSVTTSPDECMGVELEIGTSPIIGNEVG